MYRRGKAPSGCFSLVLDYQPYSLLPMSKQTEHTVHKHACLRAAQILHVTVQQILSWALWEQNATESGQSHTFCENVCSHEFSKNTQQWSTERYDCRQDVVLGLCSEQRHPCLLRHTACDRVEMLEPFTFFLAFFFTHADYLFPRKWRKQISWYSCFFTLCRDEKKRDAVS